MSERSIGSWPVLGAVYTAVAIVTTVLTLEYTQRGQNSACMLQLQTQELDAQIALNKQRDRANVLDARLIACTDIHDQTVTRSIETEARYGEALATCKAQTEEIRQMAMEKTLSNLDLNELYVRLHDCKEHVKKLAGNAFVGPFYPDGRLADEGEPDRRSTYFDLETAKELLKDADVDVEDYGIQYDDGYDEGESDEGESFLVYDNDGEGSVDAVLPGEDAPSSDEDAYDEVATAMRGKPMEVGAGERVPYNVVAS
jgi:hypothetical protein